MKAPPPGCRVWLETDLSAVRRNYARVAEIAAPAEVLCVVKADAYGLGADGFARALHAAGCRRFGVADAAEARQILALRLRGAAVQILSAAMPEEIAPMVAAGVVMPVSSVAEAKAVSAAAKRLGRTAKVHVKVDTGMGRLGVLESDAAGLLRAAARLPGVEVEGIMTHFPMAADPSAPQTRRQAVALAALAGAAARDGIAPRYLHCAASDAIANFRDCSRPPFNLVRAGLVLHGGFDRLVRRRTGVEQVFALRARVVQVRTLPAGSSVGYGATFVAKRKTCIATIAAGYADGVPLALSNRGRVVAGGSFCPVVGRVSMDYTTVDATRAKDLRPGDVATLLGRDGNLEIRPEEWAAAKGTHPHDILCSIGPRTARTFVK